MRGRCQGLLTLHLSMMENRRWWREILSHSRTKSASSHSKGEDRDEDLTPPAPGLSPSPEPSGDSKGAGGLCETCADIFRRVYPFDSKDAWRTAQYTHHDTVKSLSTSANSGCQICLRLWDKVDENRKCGLVDDPFSITGSKYSIADEKTGAFSGNMYELQLDLSLEHASSGRVDFILQPLEEMGKDDFVAKRKISDKILTGASLDLAKEWFDQCKTAHDHCNQEPKNCPTNWVPTRLVDVSSTGSIRVVETDDSRSYRPYMTLSHRWGTNLEFKLRRDNLEEMNKGFSTSRLPQTLADAVGVCKLFDVNYIWIDNLCILQDNAEDFEREADSMGKIYGNAVCNISATAALDGHQGIFSERPARSLEVCEVTINWRGRPSSRYVILDWSVWREGVVRAPANRRAWIVQERLLAKRVLHFGSRQLFWECHELEACETWPHGLPVMVQDDDNGFKRFDVKRGFWMATDDFPGYRAWNKVVYTYTGSGLTFPRDKLIALAGIASQMQTIVGGSYIAGLWSSYLPSELLWWGRTWGAYSVRSQEYRAPTWSWASVDVEITRHLPRKNDLKPMCTIVESKVEPLTDNIFGQIVSGSIVMYAKMYTSEKLRSKGYIHETDKVSMVAMDVDPASIGTDCLYFCLIDKASLLPRRNPACRGLVLQPVGSSLGQFCRVGYFHVAESRILDLLDKPDIDRESDYPCQFYDELRREHMFTII